MKNGSLISLLALKLRRWVRGRNMMARLGRRNPKNKHPRARNDYDEETAYESYMNPEPGFQSGPGDSVDAD